MIDLKEVAAGTLRPTLPEREVYIEALQDTILIQPVPLERYRQYQEVSEEQRTEAMTLCVAESISRQADMTLEEATELVDKVRAQLHPAAFDEISTAVMETMFGRARLEGIAGTGKSSAPTSSSSPDSVSPSEG